MSAPAATKGRFRAILERLDAWIDTALTDAGYSSYYITMDYTQLPTNLSTMPYVTIKVERGIDEDETYDRLLPEAGSMTTYFFTLHVFHSKTIASGQASNRDVHICARHIMNYLVGRDQQSTEISSHGIIKVLDVSARESDPARLWNLRRMIVSGLLWVKREDSP